MDFRQADRRQPDITAAGMLPPFSAMLQEISVTRPAKSTRRDRNWSQNPTPRGRRGCRKKQPRDSVFRQSLHSPSRINRRQVKDHMRLHLAGAGRRAIL